MIILVARLTFGVCERRDLIKSLVPHTKLRQYAWPPRRSSIFGTLLCTRRFTILNYGEAQGTVSRSSTARADRLSEPCEKLHHAIDELNWSNTRGKHSKNINPHNHMWSRSHPTPTHKTAHDATIGKHSRSKQKSGIWIKPSISMKMQIGLILSLPTTQQREEVGEHVGADSSS